MTNTYGPIQVAEPYNANKLNCTAIVAKLGMLIDLANYIVLNELSFWELNLN